MNLFCYKILCERRKTKQLFLHCSFLSDLHLRTCFMNIFLLIWIEPLLAKENRCCKGRRPNLRGIDTEKLTVVQLVKNLSAFYRTGRFITVFTKVCCCQTNLLYVFPSASMQISQVVLLFMSPHQQRMSAIQSYYSMHVIDYGRRYPY
jgi:hypothetical protein